MKSNKYEEWKANENLPDKFYLNQLVHEKGQLRILFKELDLQSQEQLSVIFKSYLAYRIVQESGRLKSLENDDLKSFKKTTESEFISWFKEEALGIYDDQELTHYVIVNLDNIVDIISEFPPFVEWV